MRAAVLSDVHGNIRALEAVLAHMQGVDIIVANGDLLAYGPRPAETLRLLRSLPNVRYVSGNNDRNLVERRWLVGARDGWEAEAFDSLAWTAAAIGSDGLDFVATWSFSQTLPMAQPVRVVHASPVGDSIGMFPWTSPDRLAEMAAAVPEAVLVCGHTHLFMDRQAGGKRILSDGSAGFPFDRDKRLGYIVLDDAAGQVAAFARRVDYDGEAALADVEAACMPFAQVIAYQIRHASLMPKDQTDYAHREVVAFAQ